MDLDALSQIESLDKSDMLGSVQALPEQLRQAGQDLADVKAPGNYKNIKSLVLAGMGASALGGHIVKSFYGPELSASLEVVSDYHLPAYVNRDTLVVLSSYSGSTEETLSCAKEAIKCGAKILVLTSGGELAKMARKNNWPGYLWEAKHNPCGSPRMGLGYSLFGLFIWLGRLGLIKFGPAEIKKALSTAKEYGSDWAGDKQEIRNQAKQLAHKLHQRVPFLLAAPWLAGNLHAWANQMNENAKTFGGWFLFPEINHHLMEGLVYPDSIAKDLVFVFVESAADDSKMQKRMGLTKEVVKKSGLEYISYQLQSKDKLAQVFELLTLGGYVSFYLAMLYEVDPTPIPAVTYFKERL